MQEGETDPIIDDFLAHYGAKGMHWGIRKDDKTGSTELTPQETKILKAFDPDGSNSERMRMMYDPDSDKHVSPETVGKQSRLTPGQKKALKIGAGVALTGLALYGAYKYSSILKERKIVRAENDGQAILREAREARRIKDNPHIFGKSSIHDFWAKHGDVSSSRLSEGVSEDYIRNLSTEAHHFPAGSIVKRVVTRERHELAPGGFYASYKSEDVERYKAIMPIYWKVWGRGDNTTEGYVASLRAVVDVRAPSQADTVKLFKGIFDEKIGSSPSAPTVRESLIRTYSQRIHTGGKVDDDALIREVLPKVALNWGDNNDPITKRFFTRLMMQGYNAVPDLNDIGSLADSPMRFLDGSNFEVAGHERLTRPMVDEAQKNILTLIHMMLDRMREETPIVEDFLAHYGAKGMHWGIRKDRETRSERSHRNESQKSFRLGQLPELKTRLGQSLNRKGMTKEQYDQLSTKEVTVSVGKTLRRTTRNPDGTIEDNLFVSRTMKDSQIYRGVMPSSKFLGSYRRPTEGYHEVTMKVVVQLKSPSEKERVDAFVRLMDERSIKTSDGNTITGKEWLTESGYGRQAKKLESLELGMMYYQKFTKSNGVKNSPVNSAYFNALKKKGYNAIVDDNDRNIVSKEPWLIIDAKGSLKNLRVKPLSVDDILKAQKNLVFPDIAHFGTKGMHWGIRKDEDRSTESRSARNESKKALNAYMYKMAKDEPRFMSMTKTEYMALSTKGETFAINTTIRRISMGPSAQVKGALYVSRLAEDSAYYRGAFPAIGPLAGKKGGGKKVYKQPSYEMQYNTVMKLSAPSEKVRVDTYLKLLDTPSIKLEGKNAPITGREFLERHALHPVLKKYESEELGLRTWHEFVRTQGNRTNPLAIAYFDSLRAKGFNALSDDNDRRLVTKAPLILLDPENTLKIGTVRKLTTDEINKAQRTLRRNEGGET